MFLKKSSFLLLLVISSTFAQTIEEKLTTASNISMTVSNLGIIGNAFTGSYNVLDYPSCEFPRNSGVEHLFEGGLWIGAQVNGQPRVTTGAVDDSQGYSTGRAGFEFTANEGAEFDERSSLVDNPNYRTSAVSHQDFVADFYDTNLVVPGTNIRINNHEQPLGVQVHFESYNWNYNFANFFVILNFEITNVGNETLDSLHIGYWTDGVIRNTNVTLPGGSAFFSAGGNGFVDSLSMGYEFDAAGDTAFTRSYFGLKFLGAEDNEGVHHPEIDNTLVHYNAWQFRNASDPLYFFPTTDQNRYSKMALGLNHNDGLDWESVQNTLRQPSNRSNLISAGPFNTLEPGETIKVSFAIVCAKMFEDGNSVREDNDAQKTILYTNGGWAQTTYNGEDVNFNGLLDEGEDRDEDGEITRFILPSPPDIPQKRIIAKEHEIEIYWTGNSEASIDPISNQMDFEGYRIYKSSFGFDVLDDNDLLSSLQLIAEFDKAGNEYFYNTGFQSVRFDTVIDGVDYKYKYVIDNLQSGWQHGVAITSFDRGDEINNLESLESSTLGSLKRVYTGTPANRDLENNSPYVYPNPYYGGAEWEGNRTRSTGRKIVFANLPARAAVRIYNSSGDLIDHFQHDQEYNGSDIEWFNSYSEPNNTLFSGGEHAWDLLSGGDQIIARGIYVFFVEDLESGEQYEGQFVVIK